MVNRKGTEMKDFGMFTPEGNAEVGKIIEKAKKKGWDWSRTYAELCFLAHSDAQLYGEVMDTAVRETVYEELGYAN
jgi:hypothetical protein